MITKPVLTDLGSNQFSLNEIIEKKVPETLKAVSSLRKVENTSSKSSLQRQAVASCFDAQAADKPPSRSRANRLNNQPKTAMGSYGVGNKSTQKLLDKSDKGSKKKLHEKDSKKRLENVKFEVDC